MSDLVIDRELVARLVFLQEQTDAHNDRADDRAMMRPEVVSKIRTFRDTITDHQEEYIRGSLNPDVDPGRTIQPGRELYYDGKKFRPFNESEETLPQSLTPAAREQELVDFQEGEKDFREHCKAETGLCLTPEKVAEKEDEKKTLLEQTHELARRLESVGVQAYRQDDLFMWVTGVHTQQPKEVPPFRRCCLLPTVAASVRAKLLAALEYWFQDHHNERFYTLTSGGRVRSEHLRERISEQHARVNRLNTYLRERWGSEIVFRSTELGGFDPKGSKKDDGRLCWDTDGEPLYHVHTHCVVHSLVGYRHPKVWSEMLAKIGEFWGHHWDDGGRIKNVRECVKYVFKPAEILKLSAEQLKKLHVAIFRMRLVTPLGALRKEIKSWGEMTPRRVLRRITTPDGPVWRLKIDQNAHAQIDDADRWAAFDLERDAYKAELDQDLEQACIQKKVTPMREALKGDWCRVVARVSPSAGPSGVKEPRVVVIGTKYDPTYVNNHPLVKSLWSDTVHEWEAGVAMAAAIRVHCDTLTSAEKKDGLFGTYVPERSRPPDPVLAAEN